MPGAALPPGPKRRRVLVIGGGLAGLAAARTLRKRFRVTVVDAKEYFEFTSGILRAVVQPSHLDSLTFLYHEALERRLGVGFICGEVTMIDGQRLCAHVRTTFDEKEDVVPFDFCLVAIGCSCNPLSPTGETPWRPTVHQAARAESEVKHLDERYLQGRRRGILEEYKRLHDLERKRANVPLLPLCPL